MAATRGIDGDLTLKMDDRCMMITISFVVAELNTRGRTLCAKISPRALKSYPTIYKRNVWFDVSGVTYMIAGSPSLSEELRHT
jgi:hypothetical protein